MIFAPMLWELTLSFHLLNSRMVLGVYAAVAVALAWSARKLL